MPARHKMRDSEIQECTYTVALLGKSHLRHVYDEGRGLVAGAVGHVGDQALGLLGQAREVLGGGGEELASLFFGELGGGRELDYNHF